MFTLPDLEYSYRALEPVIGRKTVDAHYNLHHAGYLKKLNSLLAGVTTDYQKDYVWIIQNIDVFDMDIRDDILYNDMAVLNHNLYWTSINPKHRKPKGKLLEQINLQYGNYENLERKMKEQASYLVGSGYTFLVSDQEGKLNIINTSNQDSPYLYNLLPLLTIDLWEHSYYLDYLNKRQDYINNFFSMIDFDYANKAYEKLQKSETK